VHPLPSEVRAGNLGALRVKLTADRP
jgi:hypothetical protein